MPKNNKVTKNSAGVHATQRVASKLRIGTRKSGTSAHAMTTAALQEVLVNTDKARYRNKAIAVLQSRGVAT